MRHRKYRWALAVVLLAAWLCPAQEVVDRIVARVESEIVLWSDVRELSRYQLLVDGKAEPDATILERLIDQWIVRNEAGVARFPQPGDDEISRSLERLKRSFSSAEAFEERRQQSGLTEERVRAMLRSQLYLSSYLDSRFRPTIQIEEKEIDEFYKSRVVPRAESRGQAPPSLDAARDFIQEALVQRAINEQADRWMKESRARLRVQILMDGNSK